MPQKTQKPSEHHSPRVKKAAEIIRTLRFLWRQSRSLPKELQTIKLQPVPRSVLGAYAVSKAEIEAIYGSDHLRRGLLYHGTGALQYDGYKYGTGMTGKLRRPIDAILEDGLTPHADPWAVTEGSPLSVSFATVWSYARFYAEAHQTPDDPLEWEYGNRTGWFSYCIVGTARQSLGTALLASNILKLGRPKQELRTLHATNNGYSRLQRWALDLRRDVTPQTSMIDVICGQTDIPGNFGAIITVSEDDVPLAPMGLGGTYEKRAARPVRPEEFTSLAVPLNKVEEYAAKVHRLGYSFPVLSIEVVEYHMSHFPIQELAHAHRATIQSI
ncbi:MAG: hypothetical protein ACREGD_00100 [Candidatus Saccharimonadales bacterium]